LSKYEGRIETLTLVPSGGGAFEVAVDGDLVFSKRHLGRHAEPGEVVRKVGEKLAAPSS
jgi:selenoprotein W-related protein